VDRCDRVYTAETGESLLQVLYGSGEAGTMDQTAHAQPALFAVEVALAALWQLTQLVL